jgi:hypothetical protein
MPELNNQANPMLHPLDEVILTQQVRAIPGVLDAYRLLASGPELTAPVAAVAALPTIVAEAIAGALPMSTANAVSVGTAEGHATIETSIATSAASESTRIAREVADLLLAAANNAAEPGATVHVQISRIS